VRRANLRFGVSLVRATVAALLTPCPLARASAHSARGSKKEDFEHVESLLRRPRKIVERKKREMVEEESDPRKEVLLAYQACTRESPVIILRSR
jgi:hypothetical protein